MEGRQPQTRLLKVTRSDTSTAQDLLMKIQLPAKTITASGLEGLILTASNDEDLYSAHLYHIDLQRARVASLDCSPEEWLKILGHILLGPTQYSGHEAEGEGADRYPPDSIELVGVIEKMQLILTIRKTISGIKQRMGSLVLHRIEPPEDFSFFNWCTAAAEECTSLESKVADLRSQVALQEQSNMENRSDLDDFQKARSEQDDILYDKFTVLINNKKGEIRRLMSILRNNGISLTADSEDTDSDGVSEIKVEATPDSTNRPSDNRRAGRSKKKPEKRKKPEEGSETEAEVEVKQEAISDPEELAEMETDREISEDSDDNEIRFEQPAGRTAPPPRRELPFQRSSQRSGGSGATKSRAPTIAEDLESDDEL